jgi:2'-5' RNA ligase
MLNLESALIVPVPAAETLVGPFRDRYDPGAALGVPAHITILYPFKLPGAIDETVERELRRLFGSFGAFHFTLTAVRRFGDEGLYLAPEPAEPFRQLTLAAQAYSPETPPYGGQFSDIVPHLTVARRQAEKRLDAIACEFEAAAAGDLPIRTWASAVVLMDTVSGRWAVRAIFKLMDVT